MNKNFKPMLAVQLKNGLQYDDYVISPKFDGCFSPGARVWTEGGLTPIKEIVDNQMNIRVASFNEITKEIEFKPVVGWFNNGKKSADSWMAFSTHHKITKNHKVYTDSGWESAQVAGDRGYVLDSQLESVLIGMLLGDGCAVVEKRRKEAGRWVQWRLAWSNRQADVEYGRKKSKLLGEWLSCREKNYTSGYGFPQTAFTTSVCSHLPFDISRFYVTDKESDDYGRRKQDLELKDLHGFDDLSLALWFFDDGTVQANNGNPATPRMHICVARYSDQTLAEFVRLFQTKYGITPSVGLHGKDRTLSFSSVDTVYLMWRIGKVAGSLMPRKMIEGVPLNEPTVYAGLRPGTTKVGRPLSDISARSYSAYDIEVQDNHNYIIEGQLVHNCRAIVSDSFVMSRSLKLFPNKFIQEKLADWSLEGFDGELIVGSPTAPDVYNSTNRGVMAKDGKPDFKYYVFDYITEDLDTPYEARHKELVYRANNLEPRLRQFIEIVPQFRVVDEASMRTYEEKFLAEGYEGAMLRRLSSPYKCGRSTEKQGWLLKLKRFSDSECRVIGFECLYSNQNEARVDALGHTERSSHKANLVPMDTLGKLIVKDLHTGVEFSIGSGFTAAQRKELWEDKDNLIGKIVKYKFFNVGIVDKPRFPIFLGFRNPIDM